MRKNSLSYPVEFVNGVFDQENPALAETLRRITASESPRVMIVADYNVVQRIEGIGRAIGAYFKKHSLVLAGAPEVIGGGEKSKVAGFPLVERIVTSAVTNGIGPDDVLLALGGGSVLDIAGFAAALIGGGAKLVRMPTTPASVFDGAFASVAALDTPDRKDAISVASVPAAVIIDCSLSSTVLDGVWRGGYAEAVRIALAADSKLMKRLAKEATAFKNRAEGLLESIARELLEVRLRHGATDFALWSAHWLEAVSAYKLPHGYAVAIGVLIDSMYSRERAMLKDVDFELVRTALEDCGAMEGAAHSRHLLSDAERILPGLAEFRRVRGGRGIVIPVGIGKSALEENPDVETIKSALNLIK